MAAKRFTGASRYSNRLSAIHAAISAPYPQDRLSSYTRSAFPVFFTLAETASWSHGESERRSITSTDTPPVVVQGPCGTVLEVFNPLRAGLTPVGTDTTLDIATWNLEFFPLALPGGFECPHPTAASRVQATADLINRLELDIIAVQEISSPAGFQSLLALCPGYAGLLTTEDFGCNFQRVGFIYKTSEVRVKSWRVLELGDEEPFPRAPLQADFAVTFGERSYSLSVIAVHLKASGDFDSVQRRRAASRLLKEYLDGVADRDPNANFMIAGDWNDRIEESLSTNSFPDFVQDPEDYGFLTWPLAGKSEFASIGSTSLIDHLLVNRAACADFSGARVTTLRLDRVVSGYSQVSDHRPVMVQAPIFR